MPLYVALRDRLLRIDDPRTSPSVTERLGGKRLECVDVHPSRPDRVFCGTFDGGLRRSTDGGTSWDRIGTDAIDPEEDPETAERRGAGDVSVMSVAIDPTDPAVVWAGTEPSALFRSSDGGETWTRVGGISDLPTAGEWAFPPRPYTHHVRWIEIDPTDPDRVYVGIEAGALLVTPDAGETWIERPSGSRRDNHTLATHPDAPGRVYSAAGDGYAESTDSGESWDRPQDGLDHRYVWSVAVDPGDPNTVLVSAANGAGDAHGHGGAEHANSQLYRRAGETWNRIEEGIPTGDGILRAVLAAGAEPGELFAVNNRGVYRTTDAGRSWAEFSIEWPLTYQDLTVRGLAVV